MTETTAARSPPTARTRSSSAPSAGPPPAWRSRLGDDGEVLVRGPVVTPGYHRQDEATRALIDDDGWVHTGDIGTLDDDGFFAIVDRKKELIITSAGKNIAPSNIENYLKESPIVGHAMAVGDGPAVRRRGAHPRRRDRSDDRPAGGRRVHRPRRPRRPTRTSSRWPRRRSTPPTTASPVPSRSRRWELLPTEWTAESAELTPTLKLKRRVVDQQLRRRDRGAVRRLSEAEPSLLVFVPSEGGVEERSDDHAD